MCGLSNNFCKYISISVLISFEQRTNHLTKLYYWQWILYLVIRPKLKLPQRKEWAMDIEVQWYFRSVIGVIFKYLLTPPLTSVVSVHPSWLLFLESMEISSGDNQILMKLKTLRERRETWWVGKIEKIGNSKSRPVIIFAKIIAMAGDESTQKRNIGIEIKQRKKNEVKEGKIYIKFKCNRT